MIRSLFQTAVLLSLISSGALIVAMSQPPDPALRAFLLPDDCTMPCWAGIEAGVTPVTTAVAVLETHPWVSDVRLAYNADGQNGIVRWTWTSDMPFAPPDADAYLYISANRVSEIELETTIPLGAIWLVFGPPGEGEIYPLRGARREHTAYYRAIGLDVSNTLDCSFSLGAFWQADSRIHYTSVGQFATMYPDARARLWRQCP